MKTKEKIKKEDWGRFIEHRPYFRQMSEEDYQALKRFVDEQIFQQKREMWRR